MFMTLYSRAPALKHILLRLVYVSDGIHFCVCALFCCSVWCCVEVTVTSNSSLPLTAIDSLTVQTNVFSDCMSLRGPLRQTNVISFSFPFPGVALWTCVKLLLEVNMIVNSMPGALASMLSSKAVLTQIGLYEWLSLGYACARQCASSASLYRVVSQSFETLWTCSYNGNH